MSKVTRDRAQRPVGDCVHTLSVYWPAVGIKNKVLFPFGLLYALITEVRFQPLCNPSLAVLCSRCAESV